MEINLAKQRGELMPAEAIAEVLKFHNATVRSKLLSIPSRYRSLVSAASAKQIDLLDSLIRDVLTELSYERFPPEIRELARQYFSDLHATAKIEGERMGGQLPSSQS